MLGIAAYKRWPLYGCPRIIFRVNTTFQGWCLLEGLAVDDENYLSAYMWYTLAIYNGTIVDNSGMKDAIMEVLTHADVDMAQQMASRCLIATTQIVKITCTNSKLSIVDDDIGETI
jgi:hypothetical protein